MPDPGKHPHNQNVSCLEKHSSAVSSQGDVDIFFKPGAQRNVPPSPEFCNASGNIRIIEVLQKMESKHLSKADSHVRITSKVKENLERVRYQASPRADKTDFRPPNWSIFVAKIATTLASRTFFARPTQKSLNPEQNPLSVSLR